jgi:hypothetical protein
VPPPNPRRLTIQFAIPLMGFASLNPS